jgi:HEAT repeat protein
MSTIASFQVILDALLDEHHAFPRAYLRAFSDLGPVNLRDLLAVWPQVGVKRRRQLLVDLRALAEEDTLLSFDDFARSLLKDEDGMVRAAAIRLLWDCDDVKLIPDYLRILASDPDPTTRAAAATGLGVFILSGEFDEIPQRFLRQVEDALLVAATGSDTALVRRRAIESLGFSSRPEVPALIEAAFAHSDPDWVVSALFAMGRSSDERWEEQVLSGLTNDDLRIRQAAVEAAGELALSAARPLLLEMLQDEEEAEIVQAIIWSLSQIGGEDVRTVLITLLDQIEDDEMVEFLEEALENLEFTEEMGRFDLMALDLEEDESEE